MANVARLDRWGFAAVACVLAVAAGLAFYNRDAAESPSPPPAVEPAKPLEPAKPAEPAGHRIEGRVRANDPASSPIPLWGATVALVKARIERRRLDGWYGENQVRAEDPDVDSRIKRAGPGEAIDVGPIIDGTLTHGRRVHVKARLDSLDLLLAMNLVEAVKTDRDGRFSFDGVPDGDYYLFAYVSNDKAHFDWLQPINLFAPGVRQVEFDSSNLRMAEDFTTYQD